MNQCLSVGQSVSQSVSLSVSQMMDGRSVVDLLVPYRRESLHN